MPTWTFPTSDSLTIRGVQGRTNPGNSTGVLDLSGEEDRFIQAILSEGALTQLQASAWAVTGAQPNSMAVRIGSGTAEKDLIVIEGETPGQGNYIVRHEPAFTTVTLDAPDAATQRIDALYAVVLDATYDSNAAGIKAPRIGYAKGDLGGASPGPDPAWKASKRIASLTVRATGAGGGIIRDPQDILREQGDSKLRLTDFDDLSVGGSTVWHEGNDGPASGLNADMVDGLQGVNLLGFLSHTITAVPPGANGPPAGTPFKVQFGNPQVTTGAAGAFNIPYPTPFPGGVALVLMAPADNFDQFGMAVPVFNNHTLLVAHGQAFKTTGALFGSGASLRVAFFAIGW